MLWSRFFERKGDGFQVTYNRRINPAIIDQIDHERSVITKLVREMERKVPRGVTLQQRDFTKAAGLTPDYGGCARIGRFEVVGAVDIRYVPRDVWNALHSDGYTSFDIRSCNPTIICNLFEAPLMQQWVTDQAACIPEGATREDMKKAVNAVITSPNSRTLGFDDGDMIPCAVTDSTFLQSLRNEMHYVHETMRERYSAFCRMIKNSDRKKTGSPSIMSFLCQDVESVAIAAMASVLPPDCPMDIKHDQIDVKLPPSVSVQDVVDAMEAAAYRATGIPFKIKSTSVTTTIPIDLDALAGQEYPAWKRMFERRYFFCTSARSVMRVDEKTGTPSPINVGELYLLENPDATKVKRWLADRTRKTYHAVKFAPPPLEVDDDVYNTWDQVTFAAELLDPLGPSDDRDEILRPLMEYLYYVTGGESQCMNYTLDYSADMVQKPGRKADTFVMSLGEQGSGRNSFFEEILYDRIIGKSLGYVAKDLQELFMNFNAEAENKIIIVIQESDRADFTKHYRALKAFTGSAQTIVNRKNEKIYSNTNYARVFIISNDMNALNIPHDDRRSGCVLGSVKPPVNAKTGEFYFTWLRREVINNPKVIRAFYEFLMERDVEGFRSGNVVKESAILKTARAFNIKTMDGATMAVFLRCFIPFAERVYTKRVNNEVTVDDSGIVKAPLSATAAAFRAFVNKTATQAIAEKLDFTTEINKMANRCVGVNTDTGERVEYIKIDDTPNNRLFGRNSCVRAVSFNSIEVTGRVDRILAGVDTHETEKEALQIFSDELEKYLASDRNR